MKILISAYACEPTEGSEPGIGWNWSVQVARHNEVWVITRSNNRPAIEKELSVRPLPGLHFIYFDLPKWARAWKRGQRGIRSYYFLWQVGVYLVARRLHRQISFDLVNHVTIANFWMPTLLALLPAPFVWGPVGGGEVAPSSLTGTFSVRGRVHEALRSLAIAVGALNPLVRMTARKAVIGLAVTHETEARLKRMGCRRTLIFSNCAIPPDELQETSDQIESRPFRALSLGRIIHWKGFELGVRAFAELHKYHADAEYWIIGHGPERKRLERLCGELGIEKKVTFWGQLPRAQALHMLGACDVLLHPSLHDASPWVCFEAMAAGKPVVCIDVGGPALQVKETTGFKIPASAPEKVIRDLAAALTLLAQDRDLLAKMGKEARRSIDEEFRWQKKGEDVEKIYSTVLTWAGTNTR